MLNLKHIFLSLTFVVLMSFLCNQCIAENSEEKNYEINDNCETLTLSHALALTLSKNPELRVASLETKAAGARQLQEGLRPNPELEIEIENLGGTGESSGFDGAETTIQFSQLIELDKKLEKRKKVASIEKKMAILESQDKRMEIFSEVSKAFIAVLTAQEKSQLSDEILKISKESYETVVKRVDAGKDSPTEKTRASISFANSKISHLKAQRNLEYARKSLTSFWGNDEPLFNQAIGDMDSLKEMVPLEDIISKLALNPLYALSEAQIKKSRATLELEKSKATGDITVGAGFKRSNKSNDNTLVFGISIPLPLSDRNQGSKQEAVYNLAKSKQQQKAVWMMLKNELNLAYQEFTNAYSMAKSLKEEILPAAIEMYDASAQAYKEGKVDYLNVLDAQRTLFDVKNEYIESLGSYHTAKIDFERLVGNETKTTDISEDGE